MKKFATVEYPVVRSIVHGSWIKLIATYRRRKTTPLWTSASKRFIEWVCVSVFDEDSIFCIAITSLDSPLRFMLPGVSFNNFDPMRFFFGLPRCQLCKYSKECACCARTAKASSWLSTSCCTIGLWTMRSFPHRRSHEASTCIIHLHILRSSLIHFEKGAAAPTSVVWSC